MAYRALEQSSRVRASRPLVLAARAKPIRQFGKRNDPKESARSIPALSEVHKLHIPTTGNDPASGSDFPERWDLRFPSMTPGGDMQTGDGFWDALENRTIHALRVEIIEALRWIDETVPTPDLVFVLDCRYIGLRVEHHLRQLTRLDVVEAGEGEGLIRSHRLAGRLRP